jgi:muramoyltetrapeptide carboxypeptidase
MASLLNSSPHARSVTEGSVLSIVAPCGPFDRERFEAGVEWFKQRYEVQYDEGIFSKNGYLAGNDDRRLNELIGALVAPDVDAILCARGGYGATRLLPDLDPGLVSNANKLLVGFSDVTALHALWSRADVRSMHAPMVAALAGASEKVRESWCATLEGRSAGRSWDLETLRFGYGEGALMGGNLAVLAAMLGTRYAPNVAGKILFLEDVGERPYRIDRMLTSLTQAGWFDACSGVVLGAFTEGEAGPDGTTVDEVLQERLGDLSVPVVSGLSAGHIDENEPLLFGTLARIAGGEFSLAG